jgi:hypothetical protein
MNGRGAEPARAPGPRALEGQVRRARPSAPGYQGQPPWRRGPSRPTTSAAPAPRPAGRRLHDPDTPHRAARRGSRRGGLAPPGRRRPSSRQEPGHRRRQARRAPALRPIAEAGIARSKYAAEPRKEARHEHQHDEVATVLSTWTTAEMSGDANAIGDVLADDFTAFGPPGFALSKKDWLERHKAGALEYETFALEGSSSATTTASPSRRHARPERARTTATRSRASCGSRSS